MLKRLKRILARWSKVAPEEYLAKLTARGMVVGKNLKLMSGAILDDSHCWHITIGDDVTIAPNVHILAHDASAKIHLGYTRIGKVNVGDRVFIGASAIIMPGVSIGDDAIIGAGSVVTADVPARMVVAGNPACIVAELDDFLAKRRKEMKTVPLFAEEYTLRQDVSMQKRMEMNKRMSERFGYIV